MGIKNLITKAGTRAADRIAKLSVLSPEQLSAVQKNRDIYLSEVPSANDEIAEELTGRLLAASSVEIFNEYLNKLTEMYVPISRSVEYGRDFKTEYNIRYFEITKWVTDVKENSLEKLINVYEVLSGEACNIALIFNRKCKRTHVYLAVSNMNNASDNVDTEIYKKRLMQAIKGNFPGSEFVIGKEPTGVPCLNNNMPLSVACASNIPGEKSEKFISQTIEKLLDGIVPESLEQEYTIVLLATPVTDIENRKIHLAELYSGLAPYAGWETNFTFTQSDSVNATATFGVNVGASAGVQQGQNSSITNSQGETDSNNFTKTEGKSSGETNTEGDSVTDTKGTTNTHSEGSGSVKNIVESFWNGLKGGETSQNMSDSVSDMDSNAVTKSASKSLTETVTSTVSNSLGKAVTNTVAKTAGFYKGVNLGANVGANFARASTVTATVGKNEGIVQHFTNYNIKHLLENLELQMKRFEQSTALGMWDFAAYVLSEDQNVANNVAYSYLALTQGESSFMSKATVNLWRGDLDESDDAKEICAYIKELRHPIFGLNPYLSEEVPIANVYPAVITPTTSLSGKELSYALNFPKKSITGFPVLTCAEFGRDIVTYNSTNILNDSIEIGSMFHMNRIETGRVNLSLDSLCSHTFVTGSTGSGKSNTVYKLIDEAMNHDVKFMVIEPAKGEYKNVFGNMNDVSVFGTNPKLSPLLKINPFSFDEEIHIYEHLDRLVEIFNVAWPMYAAMPAVLKNAIEKSYEDCGWDLINSENTYGKKYYPSFSDITRNVRKIIDSSDYDAESKGAYKGALLTRLQSLTNGINGLVFTSDEVSNEKLFDSNVIIDLSRVGSSETKSLLMGILILKLQEYRMASNKFGNKKLNHITVLEEAHNILKKTSTEQTMEGSNLVGKSVEMLANAIAEMRTYGEGFVIVDQAPGLMDMSVIRNTNTKIIMRLPDLGDRELVGKAANLDDNQIKEISKLPCGVGAVYQNEWVQPILCKVDYFEANEVPYSHIGEANRKSNVDFKDKLKMADILSKGMQIGKEVSNDEVNELIEKLRLSDYETVVVLNYLKNPSTNFDMLKLAPVMNVLFPEIKNSIKDVYDSEADITEWTREANELILKYEVDTQTRMDIIQSLMTYYMIFELKNKPSLQEWIEYGGLR